MNYNLILVGSDLNYTQELSTSMIETTEFTNIISIYDIRRQFNTSKFSTEFYSQAMLYESIENSTDKNNIIILGDMFNFKQNYILDYRYILPRTKFYLCVIDTDYNEYKNNFIKELTHRRKFRVPKNKLRTEPIDEGIFNHTIVSLKYDMSIKTIVIKKSDDIYTNINKINEFCIDNKITKGKTNDK